MESSLSEIRKQEEKSRSLILEIVMECQVLNLATLLYHHLILHSFFFDGTTLYIQDFQGIDKKCGSVTPYVIDKCNLTFSNLSDGDKSLRVWYSAFVLASAKWLFHSFQGKKFSEFKSKGKIY